VREVKGASAAASHECSRVALEHSPAPRTGSWLYRPGRRVTLITACPFSIEQEFRMAEERIDVH
jgi:hypothetical protein